VAFGPVNGAQATQTVSSSAGGIGSSNIPDAGKYAEGFVRTASVVELRDGSTPTATKGRQWDPGDVIVLRSRAEITGISLIRQASADATVDWEFFNENPR
jgi:hypothetical protein